MVGLFIKVVDFYINSTNSSSMVSYYINSILVSEVVKMMAFAHNLVIKFVSMVRLLIKVVDFHISSTIKVTNYISSFNVKVAYHIIKLVSMFGLFFKVVDFHIISTTKVTYYISSAMVRVEVAKILAFAKQKLVMGYL